MRPASARRFTGPALAQVALPLGGIGTGTVSLNGRGGLQDWEIFNRPGKGDNLEKTFCALRLAPANGESVCKVVEREHLPPFSEGLGYRNYQAPALPRFAEATFTGAYPTAWIDFHDDAVPAQVSLEAYNPFIPMNVEESSIPAAILTYRVRNTGRTGLSVSLLAAMQNPIGVFPRPTGWVGPAVSDAQYIPPKGAEETLNQYRAGDGLTGVFFTAPGADWDSEHYGSAALSTPWPDTDVQPVLLRGLWWDDQQALWDEFGDTGRLTAPPEPAFGAPLDPDRRKLRNEGAAICLRAELAPGEEVAFPIVITWRFANTRLWGGETSVPVRTYVSTQFRDAWAAAAYVTLHGERLARETEAWRDALFGSTLPAAVIDAAASNLVTLRSQTVLRLADGAIYAWEGCQDKLGSCSGNCSHVWNYEQALAFLFPSLERTMRRIEFGPNMHPSGAMAFRCEAPAGGVSSAAILMPPCVDGQMGAVMQAYRDWRLSGDDGFLRELWPNIQRAIDYAWTRELGWDPNKDGLMEGRQHNTYDTDFFGPTSMTGGIYLGALKAGEAMARYLGDEAKAAEYAEVYAKGRAGMERELWNGEYFAQRIAVMDRLTVPEHLVTPGEDIPRYQHGDGCLSDQLIGQWEAQVCGLGDILDPAKVTAALAAVHRHNFRAELRGTASVQRAFALQDEAGLVLCSWPRGGRPKLPFVYADEVWTGIEYQVAAHLFYEGLVDEGLQIVEAARARYDGVRRNPFDEQECGHHYARALSSWSLVTALSGAAYDGVAQTLIFRPRTAGSFRCVVALGRGWGVLSLEDGKAGLEVLSGEVTLRAFGVEGAVQAYAEPHHLRAGDRL